LLSPQALILAIIFDLDRNIQIIPHLSHLADLAQLTHLAFSRNVPWDVLSEALSGCKKLKVLVNLWPDYCMQVAVAPACATPFSDPRFVTMMSVYTDYWSGWIAGAEGGTDFWVAAEDFISRKARQVITGKVIVSPHANHSNLD
jgi:hypothetical protein